MGSKKVGPGIYCLCMRYKTKKVPNNSKCCGGKELINCIDWSHLTKMGTHGFRAPEKEAMNLEAHAT